MHLGTPALLEFHRRHREDGMLVLATIIATEGSTYRKTGAMMLIGRGGTYEGLISGGCLEGDLLQHAAAVFETGQPTLLTYDMSADEDLVWSLGIGCDGVIHLLLQRLDAAGLDLFDAIEASHRERSAVLLALVTRAGGGLSLGEIAMRDRAGRHEGSDELRPMLEETASDWPKWRTREAEVSGANILLVHMPAQVRVLICGAGPDAVPVAQAFTNLDWDVVVADHRLAFARADRFPRRCTVTCQRPAQLADNIDLGAVDAAVLMTHHLESDAEYLRQLGGRSLLYLGLLGPVARRQRLREMAGCPDVRLHGPVGLDIGAELPASIALAIAAEVHAVLNRRDGRSLTGGADD